MNKNQQVQIFTMFIVGMYFSASLYDLLYALLHIIHLNCPQKITIKNHDILHISMICPIISKQKGPVKHHCCLLLCIYNVYLFIYEYMNINIYACVTTNMFGPHEYVHSYQKFNRLFPIRSPYHEVQLSRCLPGWPGLDTASMSMRSTKAVRHMNVPSSTAGCSWLAP
jgi:hypothetical protein